jgi:peptidoglycan pentaglycine glycine transferase (the first glycine)
MQILRLSKNDTAEIKVFLAKQEFLPVQQSLEWGKFQEELDVKSFHIGVKSEGELIAYVQGFIRKLRFGFIKIEIPRQVLDSRFQVLEIENLLLDEIQKIAKENNAVFIRFEFQKDCVLYSENLQLKIAKEENFPLATLRIDLAKSEEEILAQMKSKGRYNIRVAKKHGVEIIESNDVVAFFEILQKTTERDGFASHSQDYYEKMLRSLGKNAKLLLAKKDEKIIAGILLTFVGDTAIYYYGASDHEFRKLMAPYLLQWHGIQLAKKRGCRFYDFLGIAEVSGSRFHVLGSTKHRLAGVSDFKFKFGGEVVQYPVSKVLILRKFYYCIFWIIKNKTLFF